MPAKQQKDGKWKIVTKAGTLGKRNFTSKKNALAAQRSGGSKKPGKKVARRAGTKAVTTTGSKMPGAGKSYQAVRLPALAVAPVTHQILKITTEGKDFEAAGRDLIAGARSRPHLTHIAVVGVDLIVDKSRRVGQAAAMSRGSVTAWMPEVYAVGMGVVDALRPGSKPVGVHGRGIERVTGYNAAGGSWSFAAMRTYRLIKHGGQLVRIAGNRVRVLQRVKRVVQENILRPVGATL